VKYVERNLATFGKCFFLLSYPQKKKASSSPLLLPAAEKKENTAEQLTGTERTLRKHGTFSAQTQIRSFSKAVPAANTAFRNDKCLLVLHICFPLIVGIGLVFGFLVFSPMLF